MSTEAAWVATGVVAQGCFTARILIQWLVSERRGMSVVPIAFWYLSVFGGVLLLGYAVHRHDPVFIMGQSAGLVVYARNLMLLHRAESAGRRAQSGQRRATGPMTNV